MATKFYLTNTAADISPTVKGGWSDASPVVFRKLGKEPEGSYGSNSNASTEDDTVAAIFVSDPIGGQTITGTVNGMVMSEHASGSGSTTLSWHVYVSQGDSTSLTRGTLVNHQLSTASGLTTTLRGNALASESVSSVAAQQGDRIVIEIGSEGDFGTVVGYGGTGSDLTSGSTTTNNPGWIEFSMDLSFGGVQYRAFILE